MASNDENKKRYTGDRDAWAEAEAAFEATREEASPDAIHIACAIRAGLSELAVDVASLRAFGAGQHRDKGSGS